MLFKIAKIKSDMQAGRLFFCAFLFFLICGCGTDRRDGQELDFVGAGNQKYAAREGSTRSQVREQEKPRRPLVIDLIHDLVFRYRRDGWTLTTKHAQVNLDKLRTGGLDLVFSALPMTPGQDPVAALNTALQDMNKIVADAGGEVEIVSSFRDALAARDRGVIPMMLLLEGADAFVGRLDKVAEIKRRGLKIVGLVSNRSNRFADTAISAAEEGGLTPSGLEFLRICRDLGLVVDLTHASPDTFWDVLKVQAGTALVSHTAARALRDHPRNLNDLQIVALRRYGGLMGLVFNPDFLRSGTEGRASLDDVVAHIMHVKRLGSIESLALGTDFNGIHPPVGLADISKLPALRQALKQQGLTDGEIDGFMGGNARRILEESERSHGSVKFVEDEILRPIDIECDVVIGEHEGTASLACNKYLLDNGPVLPPQSRHKTRIRDMTRRPARLELFGEPSTPWQVEGQNLAGRTLFNRIVALDEAGRGQLSLPADRNLTRLFCSPTRTSSLHEIVVWGH
jgi:membrane dipeptidase